jgi:DNA-binding MarR family transcriptional regulator
MIARDPGVRLRDVAAACDVTERTVQGIVADLEGAGYLTRRRLGRRNRYVVTPGTRFRHRAEADHEIAGLLTLMIGHFDEATNMKQDDPNQRGGQNEGG